MPALREHVASILRVVQAQEPEADANVIHRSWRRCFNQHALDPEKSPDVRVETAGGLRERRQRCEEYLYVARAGMEQLYKHVSQLGYVLLLTDAEGVALDFIGGDTLDTALRRAGLARGANWNEGHAGTGGIGTCIAERSTVVCDREDHFFIGNFGLSCSCTPLFDPEGELMGTLDVSLLSSSPDRCESLHLARNLTVLHARLIEDANFIREFREHWIMRLGTVAPLVDVHGELMLAVDRDGCIVGANNSARRRLRLLDSAHTQGDARTPLVGSHLSGIFRSRIDDVWRLTKGNAHATSSLVTTWNGDGYSVSMIAPKAAPRLQTQAQGEVRPESGRCPAFACLSGGDPHMEQLLDRAERLLDKQVSIFLKGETGTGKEVLAHALHNASSRAARPFIAVNCAAIPESLIESELFGYAPGTFTGARSKGMKGLIQRSDAGTLFLDEIGDMPLMLQTRLLRVLAEHEVLPLGADQPVRVDLSVVAASHRDLRCLIGAGTFREDLYYRLCGATLTLPALRERTDQAFLIERILRAEAASIGGHAEIDARAREVLLAHDWPGNIRELRNALCYALSIADGQAIGTEHLPQELVDAAPPRQRPSASIIRFPQTDHGEGDQAEGAVLRQALQDHHWNVSETARAFGVCRATVYRRMKRLGIVSPTRID